MFTLNDKFLYVAGTCFTSEDGKTIMASLKRDFEFGTSDNIHLYFDTFNDFTNGFAFGVTPKGVQREGLISAGQEVSTDWDNKWYSEVVEQNGKWTFEMAIPFKTIRYNSSSQDWNFLILRQDLNVNERTLWTPIPIEYRASNLSFAARLHFVEPLPKSGTNISLIPYVSGGVSKNHLEGTDAVPSSGIGFDAKIGITSGLNLDLTVNPDFSQVEVDRQVTNLTRFELFFPERRQFFLENSDLFATNGFPSARPFFSRRIGLASNNGITRQIPLLYGIRLSGKLSNTVRVGLLNSQTLESPDISLPSQNFSIGIIQKKIFSRSNISFLFANKENTGISLADSARLNYNTSIFKYKDETDKNSLYLDKYNRVFGFDYNLYSPDNKWEGNAYYHRSLSTNISTESAVSAGAFLGYTVKNFSTGFFSTRVGENYEAEIGFVPRTDVTNFGNFSSISFWPKNSKYVNTHGPGIRISNTADNSFNKTDFSGELNYKVTLLNTMKFEINYTRNYQKLRSDFYITSDNMPLPSGMDYTWDNFGVEFNSDTRKLLAVAIVGQFGGFYNGTITNIKSEVNYRVQPYGSISFTADYNKIDLPDPFSDAQLILLGPKIDITFSKKLFLTTFVQYNEQAENVNINTRLQWRFKPASDLFVVYTDNYFPSDFSVKNRGIIAKFTYWLNI